MGLSFPMCEYSKALFVPAKLGFSLAFFSLIEGELGSLPLPSPALRGETVKSLRLITRQFCSISLAI